MCKECGCGQTNAGDAGEHRHDLGTGEHTHPYEHEHPHPQGEHTHFHQHDSEHPHDRPHDHLHAVSDPSSSRRTLQMRQPILEKNDRLAERNRGFFQARSLVAVNVLSSPGSGKTTFLGETLKRLRPLSPAGVIVGDLATDNDAARLRETGAPVVQVTTGTVCHLESEMITRALKQMDLAGLEFLFIENVGNLVCPAAYDLGERLRVVLFSVPEGEDKPLKYPPMFQSADAVVISKIDLAEPCEFKREVALANLRKAAPGARIFEVSSRTGAGFDGWLAYLQEAKRTVQDEEVA